VSNAVKFTDSGIIRFGYTLLSEKRLLFFVEDTGPGINKDNLDVIFERFRQEDESMTRKHDGAGLGLNIVRNILKILGTDISVESEKGRGSKFFFEMDYETAEASISEKKIKQLKIDPAVREDIKEKQVLIVDDHELSYRFTSSLLNKAGINTMYACSGIEALQLLSERDMIDLVLLDIQMPGMDGLEVLSRIREKKLKLPVIAQTAHALSGDREKYLSCGFNDYLSKPIDRNELISKILSFLSKK
jgi:CheY-like chemotaxis protein/anti-sigma regulatory factor (Ser/Thr protein kinase)